MAGMVEDGARTAELVEELSLIGEDLDLDHVLRRIVAAACRLTGARYGALGVLSADRTLADFVVHGMTEEQVAGISHWPKGRGLLGLLTERPRVLRLDELSAHPRSVGFPDGHPPMASFLGAPLRVRGAVFGNLYLTEKPGGFTVADEQVVKALSVAAGASIANARLFEESEHRRRWVQASAEITTALLGPSSPQHALGLVVRKAREMARADIAAIAVEDDEGHLRVAVRDGELSGLDVGTILPAHGTPGGQPSVSVPFTAPAGAEGRLVVAWRHQRARDDAGINERAIRGFADQAALALDRVQAQEDRASLAVFADRDRIARDLHDLVIQRLFATGLGLQGAARMAERPAVAERLEAAVDDLDVTIRDIRATIFALHHRHDQDDIRGQVLELVEEAAAKLGVVPALAVEGPVDTLVPEQVRPHVVAVVREALSNAARHGQANRVDVYLAVRDGWCEIRVRDDGSGMAGSVHESGLRNLRDRAEEVGGAMDVRAVESGGTELRWRAPL